MQYYLWSIGLDKVIIQKINLTFYDQSKHVNTLLCYSCDHVYMYK